ncbi:hypothetical protein RBC47_32300, partial [Pseudomonas fluorescens]|uniref:hypothetical protein n=1 Tax=Pseudomonas fluorescens TaxID=294 RepID=UPI003837BD99
RSPEATRCRILHNSLFTKEFSVSTAPEVGRIIDVQNLPSTPFSYFCHIDQQGPQRKSRPQGAGS